MRKFSVKLKWYGLKKEKMIHKLGQREYYFI